MKAASSPATGRVSHNQQLPLSSGKARELPSRLVKPAEIWSAAGLSSVEIEYIVATVPGGSQNVEAVYPLASLQQGMLFHHTIGGTGDPYLKASIAGFRSRNALDGYLKALQSLIDRHDILRTAIVWEQLREPVQVLWRRAVLPVEEVILDRGSVNTREQLLERFNPRKMRIDLRQAPLMRAKTAYEAASRSWFLLVLLHHMTYDAVTLERLQAELAAYLTGRGHELPRAISFREFVAEASLSSGDSEHEEFFQSMMKGLYSPTEPFGLAEVLRNGGDMREARYALHDRLWINRACTGAWMRRLRRS
jgi:hypothetical protein